MRSTAVPLVLFALLILFGWTLMAAGMMSVWAGGTEFSTQPHRHDLEVPSIASDEPMLLSAEAPCVNIGTKVRCST
jgi:hypothetical protein